MRDTPRIDLREVDHLPHAVAQVAATLKGGGVVLVPTETVYGLMCLPMSPRAVQQVFTMKARPASRRLPIIVSGLDHARQSLPLDWSAQATALARAFWPGPLTIACKVEAGADDWLAGRHEAAVRAPDHEFIQGLTRELGPLLMTSANQHGHDTPQTMEDALAELLQPPDLAVNQGKLSGSPSTLVNANLATPVVEREGAISSIDIGRVLDAI